MKLSENSSIYLKVSVQFSVHVFLQIYVEQEFEGDQGLQIIVGVSIAYLNIFRLVQFFFILLSYSSYNQFINKQNTIHCV